MVYFHECSGVENACPKEGRPDMEKKIKIKILISIGAAGSKREEKLYF